MGRKVTKVAVQRKSIRIVNRRVPPHEQQSSKRQSTALITDEEDPLPAGSMIVERRIKLVTEQHNIPKPPQIEGYPMKEWTVEVYVLDESGKERPARCFQKVVYNLHPSFENPVQTFHEPPFKCTNEGWGEFEMTIDCYTTEKGGKQSILHDLNFANATYENVHTVQFKNPSQALQTILRETGPLPTDEERKVRKPQDGIKKRKTFDIEKMADAIPRLGEDDLLHIIQLIHDNKSEDTYFVNNPDAGEFSFDLYTIPDSLGRAMWDYILQTSEGHRLR
ncbi:transcription initiation factor subunit [Grosmannia clavigera kw1407]|uniref:Transcription initiation factor subunit n=1 Tax=Grosmannia clavigera (strain kw1407 / UAMH 11150) TaxID=655863 RepID=F0XHK6_GROCL|nr:transcription initiation factor subunit [Grosmannia clavigera kw1407]EFX03187.1 transcription initiation factor subunit [Grosmannia clavigera kw1407]